MAKSNIFMFPFKTTKCTQTKYFNILRLSFSFVIKNYRTTMYSFCLLVTLLVLQQNELLIYAYRIHLVSLTGTCSRIYMTIYIYTQICIRLATRALQVEKQIEEDK